MDCGRRLQTTMSHPGYLVQVFFSYNKDEVQGVISEILSPAEATAERLGLRLDDLFRKELIISANIAPTKKFISPCGRGWVR